MASASGWTTAPSSSARTSGRFAPYPATGGPAIYVVGNNTGVQYDVLPDGRFVMLRLPDRRTTREIVLLRNWLAERERLEPTK